MPSRSRVGSFAIVCALAQGCATREPTRMPPSTEAPLPVYRAKVDPLQPPPRDPVAPEDAAQTTEEVARTPEPVGPFDPALLTGTWSGTYIYGVAKGGAASVAFFADLAFEGAKLTGSIIEPNTFGDEDEGELKATLVGSIDDAGVVRFTKTYDGSAGVRHVVDYVGRLDVAAKRIEGTWTTSGGSGRFVMLRHHPMPQLALR